MGCLTRFNVGIFDEVRKATNKPMGSATFEVGEVLGAHGNTKAKNLRQGGTVYARITPAPDQDAGKLHLSLRGIGLKNVEGIFGRSDPFFEIYAQTQSPAGLTWHPVYRSKHIPNNLNPDWEPFTVDMNRLCDGDLDKPILIRLWDWQKNGKHNDMGCFETSVNELLKARANAGDGSVQTVDASKGFVPRKKNKDYGKIVVTTAVLENARNAVEHHQRRVPISEVAPAADSYHTTSNASYDKVDSFSHALEDRRTPSMYTATVALSAASTMSRAHSSYEPTAPYVPAREPYVPGEAEAPLPPPVAPPRPRPSFVDYLTGGCELELCIAIDLTGSNGDPRKTGTLHYIHQDGQLNDYEKAITAVGSIIARYDSDQKFPVWGFGAKYGGVLYNCFQVGDSAELNGIAGVLEAYRKVFRTGLTMSGPTVFKDVIDLAASTARNELEEKLQIGKQTYKILLILTDGAVTNVEETQEALDRASDAPLSIVIVGIGEADFSTMKFLDNFQDYTPGGRDICQFVEFNKYKHDRRALTRETLDEIPQQLVEYFYNRGIMPHPAISGSKLDLTASEPDEEDIDLSINVNSEGEICLEDYQGEIMFDDSKYDTLSEYRVAGSSSVSSAQSSAPYLPQQNTPHAAPSAPYVPQQTSLSTPQRPHDNVHRPSQRNDTAGFNNKPTNNVYQPSSHSSPRNPYPSAAAAPASSPIFYVQVPQGVYPGQQLQVQNPITKQYLLVKVPEGVTSGGKFAVRY